MWSFNFTFLFEMVLADLGKRIANAIKRFEHSTVIDEEVTKIYLN